MFDFNGNGLIIMTKMSFVNLAYASWCDRLFIDIDEAEREKRLLSDYNSRKMKSELVQKNLDSRKLDELPNVRKSSSNSTHKFLN